MKTLTARGLGSVFGLTALFWAAGVVSPPADAACTEPPPGLVGWWSGEGDADDSAGANPGTLLGGVGFGPASVGQGFVFDGIDDQVAIPARGGLGATAAYTVDAWVDLAGETGDGRIFSRSSSAFSVNAPFDIDLAVGNVTGRLFVQHNHQNGGVFGYAGFEPMPSSGLFHLAVTFDGTTVRAYYDGVEAAIVEQDALLPQPLFTQPTVHLGNALSRPMVGVLDEVEFFDRALSQVEIQDIVAAGSDGKCRTGLACGNGLVQSGEACDDGNAVDGDGCSSTCAIETGFDCSGAPSVCAPVNCVVAPGGLVGWLPGEGDASDAAGSNTGTLLGGIGFGPAKVAQGFVFDGVDDQVAIPATGGLGFTSAYSFDAWVDLVGRTSDGRIFSRSSPAVSVNAPFDVDLAIGNVSGRLFVQHNHQNGGTFDYVGFHRPPPIGLFHLAVTYDGATVRAYYNGIEATVVEQDDQLPVPLFTQPTIHLGNALSRPMTGVLDEVEFFDRALSQAEIQAIVGAGRVGKCPTGLVCGNGLVQAGEGCDDGNTVAGDGCSPTCAIETGSDCSGTPSVCGPVTCVVPPAGLAGWFAGEGDATDSAGASNGTLVNGVGFGPAKVGQGFVFDGVDDQVAIPATGGLGFTSAYSFDAWVDLAGRTGDGRIFSRSSSAVSVNAPFDVDLAIGNVSGRLFVQHNHQNGGTFDYVGFHRPPPIGLFHLAVTYDGTTVRAYYNGNEATVVEQDPLLATPLFTQPTIHLGNALSRPMTGVLDEVEFFDRALSQAEVQALAAAGRVGKCRPSAILPDLAVSAAEIRFDPVLPAPGQTVEIRATVRNLGLTDAAAVTVRLLDFGATLQEFTGLFVPAGGSVEVSLTTSFPTDAFHLIGVRADPADVLVEGNENNNRAARVLQVGTPNPGDVTLLVTSGGTSTCRGNQVGIAGSAGYDFAPVPGSPDSPVQGGSVTVTLFDGATELGRFSGTATRADGAFSQSVIVPAGDGSYQARIDVTDGTVAGTTTVPVTVSGDCQDPVPPGPTVPSPPPGFSRDALVLAENVHFSNPVPDIDELVVITAYIHYFGPVPAVDVPVRLSDVYPVGGVLQTVVIATSTVSFPATTPQVPALATVIVPWSSSAAGAHVIRIEVDPDFEQNETNDEATRLIRVGPPIEAELTKSVILLMDADFNGVVSPGDTLRYTLDYANTGVLELTGVILIDDFDETLLDSPGAISGGGVVVGGTLRWNLPDLAPTAGGQQTYDIALLAPGTFPPGATSVVNVATLTSDVTAPIAATTSIEVRTCRDLDGDGFGAPGEASCPAGGQEDCADADPAVHPGALEVCDGVDNDCDGIQDNAQIRVRAERHFVGAGSHPSSHKEPLVDLLVGIYDKAPGSCARDVCGGINWQHYPCIFDHCTPVVQGVTDLAGELTFDLPPGDYLVIGGEGNDKHLGVSASDLQCREFMQKYLQQLVTANGKKHPGKRSVRMGSELFVIEPEYIEWSGEAELYPFVFESFEDWQVTASIAPPEGFVADHEQLVEDVDSELEAVQFTITDIGSDWVPTLTRHIIDHKQRREILVGRVGVVLTDDLARRKGLDRRGHVLDARGRPIRATGHDPRDPRPAEIVGWIEPSVWSPDWTVKFRVEEQTKLSLAIVDGEQGIVRVLAQGAFDGGEHSVTWDGLDDRGLPLAREGLVLRLEVGPVVEELRLVDDSRPNKPNPGRRTLAEDPGDRGSKVDVNRRPPP